MVNNEMLTMKLISSAKAKTSERRRGMLAMACRKGGRLPARKSSCAGRKFCLHQPSFSWNYFEINCFWLLIFLKFPQDYHLEDQWYGLWEKVLKNCQAYHILGLKRILKVIRLNSPPNARIPSIASLTGGCPDSPWLLLVTGSSITQEKPLPLSDSVN